jgi:galactokinase
MLSSKVKQFLLEGKYDRNLSYIYVCDSIKTAHYRKRLILAIEAFEGLYGADRDISVFSAPGRTEVCGNHTDHQCGRVLAASVNLDVIAVVSANEGNMIHIKSEGYPMDTLNAAAIQARQEERNTSISLIRGIVAKFTQLGYPVGGFDAYTTSDVLSGSGLSSSAAFEVLVGTIVNSMFCGGKENPVKIAQIGQYAENVYFNKLVVGI